MKIKSALLILDPTSRMELRRTRRLHERSVVIQNIEKPFKILMYSKITVLLAWIITHANGMLVKTILSYLFLLIFKLGRSYMLVVFLLTCISNLYPLVSVPFDISMRVKMDQKYEGRYQYLKAFKWLYARNNFTRITPQVSAKIPKIIHHIWLGSQFPAAYDRYYQSWIEHHPEWHFIFWTDNPVNFKKGDCIAHSFEELLNVLETQKEVKRIAVDTRILSFMNRVYFDRATNYGERSDILRYELLHRIGGLYVDTDFQALQSCTLLHHMYDLYVGIQPLDTGYGQLGIGLIGAIPGHPMMRYVIENIKNSSAEKQIICRTGPLYFTRLFCQYIKTGLTLDVALPASYFYPMGYDQQNVPVNTWHTAEAFAVHHWAGSWLPGHTVLEA